MTALTLYEIAQEYRHISDILTDTGCDEIVMRDTLEGEAWSLETKAQNVAYAIKNLDATAAAIKAAENDMADRRKAIESRAMHIKEYLKTCMEIAGVEKLSCPHFALAIRKNPPSVDVFEPSLVPAEYMKQPEPPPPAPDKAAIKAAIAEGKEVPGAMIVQGTRLDIR